MEFSQDCSTLGLQWWGCRGEGVSACVFAAGVGGGGEGFEGLRDGHFG